MERIERHDVINAVGLAAVLLVMALALLLGTRSLFGVINGGVVDKSKTEESVVAEGDDEVGSDTSAEDTTTTETAPAPTLHPAGEVTAKVGNAARRGGIAQAGTDILTANGYLTLSAATADSQTPVSIVYYVEGFEADAAAVAVLLGIAETSIAPMPDNPGIPVEGAQIIAILGSDTTVG